MKLFGYCEPLKRSVPPRTANGDAEPSGRSSCPGAGYHVSALRPSAPAAAMAAMAKRCMSKRLFEPADRL